MITFLSFASQKKENDLIKEQVRSLAAKYTDETWVYEMYEQWKAIELFLRDEPVLDIINWDLTLTGALERLQQLRRHYRQSFLMVMADDKISPMSYLRPGIMPSALLLKPVKKENLLLVIEEMMEAFLERFDQTDLVKSYVIDSREGRQIIPINQIYYIEAREKKIYIRTKQEEYGFYETIENMEKKLPDTFCRCHRSYIVNMDKVITIKASQNLIKLQGMLDVPLSRSYKKTIKEYYKDAEND